MGRLGYGFGPGRRRLLAAPTPTPTPAMPGTANIVFQLDAGAITGVSDGATLTNWVDTVNGITLDTSAGGSAPTYKAAGGSGAGGRAYVDFTAGTKYLTCASASQGALKTAIDSGDYSVIIVASHVGAATGSPVFSFGNSSTILNLKLDGTVAGYSGASASLSCWPWAAGTGYVSFGMTSTASSAERGGGANPLRRPFMRGLPFGGEKSAGGNTGITGVLGVGGRADGVVISKCRLYRILVWNRKLTPAEMWQAEQALNSYYAQTHPTATYGRVIVFDGDSRTACEGAASGTNNANAGFIYQTLAGLTAPPPAGCVANFAIGALALSGNIAKSAEIAFIGTLGMPVRAYFEEFHNIPAATAIATIASQTTAHFAYMRSIFGAGALIIGASPMSVSNSYPTKKPYDASGDAGATWGAYVRNNWAALGMDAKVEMTTNAYIGWDQITTIQTSPSGYGPILPDAVNRPGSDGVHLGNGGQAYAASLTSAVFNALPGF